MLELIEAVPRLILPGECYIWLNNRRPWILRLITAVMIPFILAWAWLLLMLPRAIEGMQEQKALRPEVSQLPGMLLFAVGLTAPVLLALGLRWLLRRVWKPSAEMLQQNEADVAQELRLAEAEMHERAAQLEQMRAARLQPWRCSGCGDEVSGEHLRCPACRRRKGATEDEPEDAPDMDAWEPEEEDLEDGSDQVL